MNLYDISEFFTRLILWEFGFLIFFGKWGKSLSFFFFLFVFFFTWSDLEWYLLQIMAVFLYSKRACLKFSEGHWLDVNLKTRAGLPPMTDDYGLRFFLHERTQRKNEILNKWIWEGEIAGNNNWLRRKSIADRCFGVVYAWGTQGDSKKLI